ncbi:hypothetical protein TREES_T100017103 [Tupaia chinensis]|uniref:Uncharacterized protein n=1 Tax=Tupaia chinensis TaxID=246437 RepID=L9KQM7_TUPCH|nr:hypothetical protein TREES_T100017103 [Tupaia chinensis]
MESESPLSLFGGRMPTECHLEVATMNRKTGGANVFPEKQPLGSLPGLPVEDEEEDRNLIHCKSVQTQNPGWSFQAHSPQ